MSDVTDFIGGSSSVPINGVMPIKGYYHVKYRAGDNTEWLKSGNIETNISLYPDALSSTVSASTTGVSYPIGNGISPAQGITWDGTYFYVCGTTDVFQYDSSGVYTGFTFAVGNGITNLRDIAWDGTYFYTIDDTTDTVFQYDSAGVYTNFSFTVTEADAYGIHWNGTFLSVIGYALKEVTQYTTAGVVGGITFSVNQDSYPAGITFDGEYWYMVGQTTNTVYIYYYDGTFTGNSFTTGMTTSLGITWDGTYLYVVGDSTDIVQFSKVVGVGLKDAKVDADSGLPIYIRIK